MKAGDLRHRVMIARLDETLDAAGAIKTDYVSIGAAWALVRDLSGTALVSAAQINPEVRVQVIMRFRNDLEPLMRITHGSRQLYIIAILDTEGHRDYLKILCTERDPHAG